MRFEKIRIIFLSEDLKYIVDMENGSVIFRGTSSIDIRLTHQALTEQSPVRDEVAGLIPP